MRACHITPKTDATRLNRYHRFIHVRHLHFQDELIKLVEAITGLPWKPENHFYGSVCTQKHADHLRQEHDRLDKLMMRDRPWAEIEKDDSRGRALPEHKEAVEGKKG